MSNERSYFKIRNASIIIIQTKPYYLHVFDILNIEHLNIDNKTFNEKKEIISGDEI